MKKLTYTFLFVINLLCVQGVLADTVNINNNNNQTPNNNSSCNNNNTQTDPRVLPEGSYSFNNGDGSGQQVYTTGEKKPYNVDNSNNCNSNASTAPIQPYVLEQGGRRR